MGTGTNNCQYSWGGGFAVFVRSEEEMGATEMVCTLRTKIRDRERCCEVTAEMRFLMEWRRRGTYIHLRPRGSLSLSCENISASYFVHQTPFLLAGCSRLFPVSQGSYMSYTKPLVDQTSSRVRWRRNFRTLDRLKISSAWH